jgi:CRP-like cAMP-binding protein
LLSRIEQLRPRQLAFGKRHVGEADWHVVLTRLNIEEAASSLAAAFRRSPVLSTLGEDAVSLLKGSMTERVARKGQTLYAEDTQREELGILLDGALAVFVGAGSRERLLFHLFPFDVFGDIEFFDRGLSVGRTLVLSPTARYAVIPYDVVDEAGVRAPAFLSALAAGISQHNRTLASELAAQVSKPILSRVAGALLPYAPPERGMHQALLPLATMTQAQVAASAGTVKEVAARAIAELERLQALRREHGHIKYLDRAVLLEIIDQP